MSLAMAKRKGEAAVANLLLASLLAIHASPAPALELAAVLENTRVSPPARVRFREERHNRLLKDALVLTGYLEYPSEGHLYKVVESPFQESFRSLGDRVQISRGGEVETIPLNRARGLQAMLSGVEAILAGNPEELESLFVCTLSGTAGAWAMHLSPRVREVSRRLGSLYVTGNRSSVTSIRVNLQDDEWYRLEILRAEPDK